MYTTWLANRYHGSAKTANSVRVTNVKIDLDRYPNLTNLQKRLYRIKSRFSISPAQMAEVYTWLAIAPELRTTTGEYFDEKMNRVKAGASASDDANIEAVMALTTRYVPEIASGSPGADRGI